MAKTTASDALNGIGRVSPATRKKVLAAAERLGYVPNSAARHLRRAATGTIGLHLPEVLTRSDYYMSFVFGAVERAARRGCDVTLITSGPGQGDRRVPRVDGVILGDPLEGDPVVAHLLDSGLPIVTCEHLPGEGTPDGVVWSRHGAMLGELLDHLRAQGAARPGLVVSSGESDWSASLHRAYLDWCAANGIEPAVRTVRFGSQREQAAAAARALLDEHPALDALVCGPDRAAVSVLPVLQHAGRRVGVDVLLASCVDSPPLAAAAPPITAIDLRPREAGAGCADLLFEILGGTAASGTERVHPVSVVPRASTLGG